jgi:HSP20 family protein
MQGGEIMRLAKRDDNHYLSPWFGFPASFFDDDFFGDMSMGREGGMNMWEDEDKIFVQVAVPGMKEKDLDVTLENGVLTVRGTKEEVEEEKEGKKKVYSSSMKSSFYYSTSLPSNAGSEVEADLEDGVLTLEVAKAEEAKPKKIEVKRK